ncbi:MAG: GNAT family N-acetyltransferase [Paracoccaceae bacterium]
MKISVEYASPRHPNIKKLLLASHQLMRDLYPKETNSYLSIDELCSSDVHFLGARQNDKYCGCGALEVKPDYGELKSFFVEPQFRGNGIASLIMQEILRTSRELNINSLKLETGIGLDNALNLYKRFNFELCEPFGKYFENGFSIFMKRDLP